MKVRIPEENMPEGVKIQNGDLMARGSLQHISKAEDLRGSEYFTVMSVGDNRRGKLSHWAVSGA